MTVKFDISSYSFKSLDNATVHDQSIKEYVISDLKEHSALKASQLRELGKVENKLAAGAMFKISPIVKKFRGIKDLEDEEFRLNVKDEAELQVKKIQQEAYDKAFQEGHEKGRLKAQEVGLKKAQEVVDSIVEMVNEISKMKTTILEDQKNQTYHLVKSLTKWVILRELTNDGEYLVRLLTKLILELQSRKNLIVFINKNRYKEMPQVLEIIQGKLGELENVRFEVIEDENELGITLESDNGIIKGTIGEQMANLDKLFESIGLGKDNAINLNDDHSDLPKKSSGTILKAEEKEVVAPIEEELEASEGEFSLEQLESEVGADTTKETETPETEDDN